MAKSVPNTTPEQVSIGKKLRQTLRGHIQTCRGGITFVGPKGVGKTRIMGLVRLRAALAALAAEQRPEGRLGTGRRVEAGHLLSMLCPFH